MRSEFIPLVEGLRELCPDNVAAVDFETYYSKTCSVQGIGNWAYCRHPEWDSYMVSIFAPSVGVSYVGDPKDAPWDKISGMIWLAHNANFDRHVYERLQELGTVTQEVAPEVWHDTADLAVWSHLPRNLKGAIFYGFGVKLSKASRTNAKGKRWPADFTEEEQADMLAYADDDAVGCWLLWAKFAKDWPEHERKLSLHTSNIEFRGIPVDKDQIEAAISVLKTALWAIEKEIPWVHDKDGKGKPFALGSPRGMARECFKRGIPAPKTTAIKNKEFLEWLDQYGEAVPAIMELSRHRRINRALKTYENLLARLRPDGRAALGLKYFGAEKTGRWSGTDGFNLQNMAKSPLYFDSEYKWIDPGPFGKKPEGAEHACDLRACIVAAPGRKLGISDLSQIEPRVLAWVIQDKVFLDACARGISPYEAHAIASMGYTQDPETKLKDKDPDLYALAKARVLALGYQAGWQKFIEMARGYLGSEAEFLKVFGADVTEEQSEEFIAYQNWMVDTLDNKAAKTVLREWPMLEQQDRNIWVNSWLQVSDFRETNPLIANKREKNGPLGIWQKLQNALEVSETSGTYETGLPSGRSLMYYEVSSARGWGARQANPMSRKTNVYGGKLTENLVQAIARDVFSLGILRLEDAGYQVLFSVHDEAIVDMPEGGTIEEVDALLGRAPDWGKSLPVASEGKLADHYLK